MRKEIIKCMFWVSENDFLYKYRLGLGVLFGLIFYGAVGWVIYLLL